MSSHLVIGSATTSRGAATIIGNLDSPLVASVDPRGLVTSWLSGWSLDWWIGADDRWHIPAREVAVRQRLIDASPVVETAMRIPSGDAVHRAYAIRRSSLDNGGELVIVEVENRSKVPVALALAVRSESSQGLTGIERIDLHDEVTVTVDGQVALLLPKPPARSCAATSEGQAIVDVVTAGEAAEGWAGPMHSPDGLAQAAFVYPLTHGTSLQVALPLERQPYSPRQAGGSGTRRPETAPERPSAQADGRGWLGRLTGVHRQSEDSTPTFPQTVPGAVDVARGWSAQVGRGLRSELPDGRLAEGVKASLCSLLLLHSSDRITGVPGHSSPEAFDPRDTACLLHPLDLYGFHEEVAGAIALSVASQQQARGLLAPGRVKDQVAADAALLWTLGQHWRLTGDAKLVEAMADAVAESAQRLGSFRPRSWTRGSRRRGLAGQVGVGHRQPWDDRWRAAGLLAAAELFAVVGQPKASRDAARLAATVQAGSAPSSLLAHLTLIGDPAIHHGRWDPDKADQHPHDAAQLAGAELLTGDPRCLERLTGLLDAASPTWTWTKGADPQSQGETPGPRYHALVAARLLQLVRLLLVRETRAADQLSEPGHVADDAGTENANGLAVATLVPETWLGQDWEVHDAPTVHGRLSYAVRWHGDRPALLWELEPHRHEDGRSEEDPSRATGDVALGVRLTAPGLDPSWSSTDPTGEALLHAPAMG